jgi:hypothetical protein
MEYRFRTVQPRALTIIFDETRHCFKELNVQHEVRRIAVWNQGRTTIKNVVVNSMLKFFVLDDSLREVVAVSSAPAPEGAFASSCLGGPPGQLP